LNKPSENNNFDVKTVRKFLILREKISKYLVFVSYHLARARMGDEKRKNTGDEMDSGCFYSTPQEFRRAIDLFSFLALLPAPTNKKNSTIHHNSLSYSSHT
jgi:hypothetical protein